MRRREAEVVEAPHPAGNFSACGCSAATNRDLDLARLSRELDHRPHPHHQVLDALQGGSATLDVWWIRDAIRRPPLTQGLGRIRSQWQVRAGPNPVFSSFLGGSLTCVRA